MNDLPDAKMLRDALSFRHDGECEYLHDRRPVIPADIAESRIRDAAECMLGILDRLGPTRLKALLDGTRVAVPVEPTQGMLNEAGFAQMDGDDAFSLDRGMYKAMLAADKVETK